MKKHCLSYLNGHHWQVVMSQVSVLCSVHWPLLCLISFTQGSYYIYTSVQTAEDVPCSVFDSDRLQNYTTIVQHCQLFCIHIALKLQAVSANNVNNNNINMCCVWNWKQCECVCPTSQYLGCSKFPVATTGNIVLPVAPVPFALLGLESLRQRSQCTWNV